MNITRCDACGKDIPQTAPYLGADVKVNARGPQGQTNRQVFIRGDYCNADCILKHYDASRQRFYSDSQFMLKKYPE